MGYPAGRRRSLLGVAAFLLVAACADRAQRDVAITPDASSGIVILSLVADAGNRSESTYWYRPAGGGGARAIELTARQPGQSPDAFPLLLAGGEIVVLQLPPGTYVIERLETRTTIGRRTALTEARFAVAFQAIAGKVLYAGQLAISRGILGNSGTMGITYERERDVPRALQAYPGLSGSTIEDRPMIRGATP